MGVEIATQKHMYDFIQLGYGGFVQVRLLYSSGARFAVVADMLKVNYSTHTYGLEGGWG